MCSIKKGVRRPWQFRDMHVLPATCYALAKTAPPRLVVSKIAPLILVAAVFGLSGCSVRTVNEIPPKAFEQLSDLPLDEPSYVALITVVSSEGALHEHSALLMQGSQLALVDPAGSWGMKHEDDFNFVTLGDTYFGLDDVMVRDFLRYHARTETHVVVQKRGVERHTADKLIAGALANGDAKMGTCAWTISSLLAKDQVLGVSRRYFAPSSLMRVVDKTHDGIGFSTTTVRRN